MEREIRLPHKVTLEERERLTLTGATEILHFDEETAQVNTAQGVVCVHGSGLKLKTLSLEGGTVAISGKVGAVIYGEPRRRRLFG